MKKLLLASTILAGLTGAAFADGHEVKPAAIEVVVLELDGAVWAEDDLEGQLGLENTSTICDDESVDSDAHDLNMVSVDAASVD